MLLVGDCVGFDAYASHSEPMTGLDRFTKTMGLLAAPNAGRHRGKPTKTYSCPHSVTCFRHGLAATSPTVRERDVW